ncbi:2-oxoacid:acceptor oxidoreductase family protein [Treponema sp.]|uniref:2-oxoacid:acceptor oxidoreductase family protein n=1 Tax=Treponema sp. TaxID=166 RepID=UPI0025D1458B|nr:2-oxoacid:acceptor oxidoreductase family protein [Treponema sp.]MCR5217893.1 2-oxoacid:acceptor oxidoreductase family protein [Treponema sp.]
MIEVLWHGRGGQGAFTAAKLLGAAYSVKSRESHALAFPSFGPERRGAPILAFTKLSDSSIGDRSQIKKADFVVFLDDTLFSSKAFDEIKADGKIFINTRKDFSGDNNYSQEELSHIVTIDGDSLAQKILSMPVTNTVMLSLLARVSGLVSKEQIQKAIELYMPAKLVAKNTALVDAVFGGEE